MVGFTDVVSWLSPVLTRCLRGKNKSGPHVILTLLPSSLPLLSSLQKMALETTRNRVANADKHDHLNPIRPRRPEHAVIASSSTLTTFSSYRRQHLLLRAPQWFVHRTPTLCASRTQPAHLPLLHPLRGGDRFILLIWLHPSHPLVILNLSSRAIGDGRSSRNS